MAMSSVVFPEPDGPRCRPRPLGDLQVDAAQNLDRAGPAGERQLHTPRDPAKLAYITQTTLSVDDTGEIINILKRRFPDINGPHKQDICYATTNRQEVVKQIAPRCDIILVVGAPNSSNSQRLVEVARKSGCDRPCWCSAPPTSTGPTLRALPRSASRRAPRRPKCW
jgi:hypothetical protein